MRENRADIRSRSIPGLNKIKITNSDSRYPMQEHLRLVHKDVNPNSQWS